MIPWHTTAASSLTDAVRLSTFSRTEYLKSTFAIIVHHEVENFSEGPIVVTVEEDLQSLMEDLTKMLSPETGSKLEAVAVAWKGMKHQTRLDNDNILPCFRLLHARRGRDVLAVYYKVCHNDPRKGI